MFLKDYYDILKVNPRSSTMEIKKAYRKLAFQFHPDKNHNNQLAETHFKEIKEAYEILSDKDKREAYNYERYFQATAGYKKPGEHTTNPSWILQQSIDLRNKISRIDPFRIDRDGLQFQLQHLLSEYNRLILKEAEEQVRLSIIDELLQASKPLSPGIMNKLALLFVDVAGSNNEAISKIHREVKERKWGHLWQKYKVVVAILLALLMCLMIYQLKV